MKKFFITSVFFLLTTFVSSAAYAGCNGSTTCSGKIERLYINQAGVLFIRLLGANIPDGSSCTSGSNYGQLKPDNSAFKNFYAMSLTALASEADISIRIVNGDSDCTIQYIVIEAP